MCEFLEKLAEKRMKFLEGLDANAGDINLDIFEDFYPDQAHFVFELLQNAEDAGATEAGFSLRRDGCRFVHNGKREFTRDDVQSITGIHNSSKKRSPDQIGKFGVGFKSVFVYTLSPVIHSGDFSFKISRLVLPELVAREGDTHGRTTFWLPFNNPRKSPEAAYAEVKAGLSELAETTLLFLANLDAIRWDIGEEVSGEVLRIKHSELHYEVLKQVGGRTTTSSHFLKFDRPVELLEKQNVAIAFELDFLPGVDRFESTNPLSKQLRIVEAKPGRVSVFFPAEKETSGLRFHLHAPFVPELSRASIKETEANRPLFRQLASLSAESLHHIRDLGLLTADFLAVLPTPQDPLPDRYKCIRESIVEEMKSEPLTPTYTKGHAPARLLLQSKASLKELLTTKDLEFLVDYEDEHYQWAIGAAQKNSNADRFLAGLSIDEWDIECFVELLNEKTGGYGPDEAFMGWLSAKSSEWHQRLYALLYTELNPTGEWYKLPQGNIVRLANGEYAVGKQCYFPSDDAEKEDTEQDDVLPRVDRAAYSSGKSKFQQENSKKFLEAIGVREVGEAEQIEVLLKRRYGGEETCHSPRKKDLKRFVRLLEEHPQRAEMFADYFIFQVGDGDWCQPGQIYLDHPFAETGLTAYYGALGEQADRYALADWYEHADVSVKRLAKFAESVGAQTSLVPTEVRCDKNPDWHHADSGQGSRPVPSWGGKDYTITGIDALLAAPSIALSKLLWGTLQRLDPNYLELRHPRLTRERSAAASQLVHHLRNAAWIPQENRGFARPAEADRDLLPQGFAFDLGWRWLKAIHFGENEAKRVEAQRHKQAQAEELGFGNSETLDRAKRFAALPAGEQERFLAKIEERLNLELPEHKPSNPERRADRVGKLAQEAPEREFEKRSRSVALGRAEVKEEAAQYLRQQYTNPDGLMICQVCKSELPFKLDDGSDYFEKVWFLTELEKHHHQNYLALCPNHAAMFQYANGSKEELMGALLSIGGNNVKVVLAQHETSIYFTRTHVEDLKAVIRAEADERANLRQMPEQTSETHEQDSYRYQD